MPVCLSWVSHLSTWTTQVLHMQCAGVWFYILRCCSSLPCIREIQFARGVLASPCSDLAYAQAIMDLTLSVRLRKLRDYYEDDVSMREKCSTLERKTNLFLAIFNGNWKDTSQKGLVHHCFMGCPCGGLTPAALRQVGADLFVEIVLASKPSVPAVSRWLKCSKSAKWFLTLVTVTAVIVCRLLGCLLVWLES